MFKYGYDFTELNQTWLWHSGVLFDTTSFFHDHITNSTIRFEYLHENKSIFEHHINQVPRWVSLALSSTVFSFESTATDSAEKRKMQISQRIGKCVLLPLVIRITLHCTKSKQTWSLKRAGHKWNMKRNCFLSSFLFMVRICNIMQTVAICTINYLFFKTETYKGSIRGTFWTRI